MTFHYTFIDGDAANKHLLRATQLFEAFELRKVASLESFEVYGRAGEIQKIQKSLAHFNPLYVKVGATEQDAASWGPLSVIASALGTESWLASLERIFREFDTDGSGEIDVNELITGLKSLGKILTADESAALVAAIDQDFKGRISFKVSAVISSAFGQN